MGIGCAQPRFKMAGDAKLRSGYVEATPISPPASFPGLWFNSTVGVSASMLARLAEQQVEYPVPWSAADMDASWLGNRLLLFIYVTQPDINLTRPRLWLNGTEQRITPAYNSRGNAQDSCFLGFYFDASHLVPDTYQVSLLLPKLNGSKLHGLFWNGLTDAKTGEVQTPLAAGNLSRCAEPQSSPLPKGGSRNVLYLVVDDMRPSLSVYNQSMYTPNMAQLAKSATTFTRAFANIAVCAPSRNSFLSGLRPQTTHIYNFINHVRQASCLRVRNATRWSSDAYTNITIGKSQGAAGECCSQCTDDPACWAWAYSGSVNGGDVRGDVCTLHGKGYAGGAGRVEAAPGVVSGEKGVRKQLTSLPESFRRAGYLTLQSGKIWHTEQGDLYGEGLPPSQDYPLSWSAGCSMANVNEIAQMWACDNVVVGNLTSQGCPIDATEEGVVNDGSAPLADKVIGDDAVAKLRLASLQQKATGRPFFLAVGFRKPHMPWRFPKPFLDKYPAADGIAVAQHPTMHSSVPTIAHHSPDLQTKAGGDPFHPMNKSLAQHERLYYYGAISWVDSRVGLVLSELDSLSLTQSTLTVLHSDHGWALGEHGQWQKFTNWEVGLRVPLMIRAPWLPDAAGRTSAALAELVDVYPTMLELAGVEPPTGEKLDGASLGWVLQATAGEQANAAEHEHNAKTAVVSQFPRCPLEEDGTTWTTDPGLMWKNNWCEYVDRSSIPWMGFTMRTEDWRLTEWAKWDGESLSPDWTASVGVELYDHRNLDQNSFDASENVNVAAQNLAIVEKLRAQLHQRVATGA